MAVAHARRVPGAAGAEAGPGVHRRRGRAEDAPSHGTHHPAIAVPRSGGRFRASTKARQGVPGTPRDLRHQVHHPRCVGVHLGTAAEDAGWSNDVREPPDLTFAVLSPGQSATDVLVRCLWYVANGVRVALYADPSRRVVIAFRPGAEPLALVEQGVLALEDIVPGFSLDVAVLFAALDPDWAPDEA